MGSGAAAQGGPGMSNAPTKSPGMGAAPAGGIGGMGGLGGMYGGMPNPFAGQQPSQMQSLLGPSPMTMQDYTMRPPMSGAPFGQADMNKLSQMGSLLGGQPQAPMQGLGAYGPQPAAGLGALIPPMAGPSMYSPGMGGMGNVGGQLRNV